ncbi:hypothetical protein [Serratia sp. JSRIV004]|uniref:hypothetical protein n=1 Tax=Serratia sp. JSRIV004 TaxID=2831895 RepID=UPI001CC19DA1|nr:hypothetical protein [Serratia sp. JSRIV004]UAN58014.1 hypothetical protein KGP21_02725 [Serratia sp. JSRIV004]
MMTKTERDTANTLRDALADAQKYLDSGRVGEGVDWVRIAARLADKLIKQSRP